jgi:ABC-type transport system substrate-binding protein
VETPSPAEVVVRLRSRSSFLLDDLTVAITKRGADGKAIGTGPYLTTSTSPTGVVMDAFHSYYRGAPKIDRIVWKAYPTSRTAWASMMRGETDFLYEVSPDALEFVQGEASVESFSFVRNYVHGVVFNSRSSTFKDAKVRLALNYAIDRAAIIDQVFKGHGTPAYTPTWPLHWAYDTSLPTYNYDPARATAMLDAAGLTLGRPQQDTRRAPSRMRFTCIFATNFPLWERMALMLQRNLAQIGVDMQLETVPVDEFNRRTLAGDFDAVLADFSAGNGASRPYVFWYSTSKQNAFGYSDSLVDAAFDRLRQAPDDNVTKSAFHDLQAQLLSDPPGMFVAYGETTRAVNRHRFQPLTPPGGDPFRTIPEWRTADGPAARDTN